MSVSCGIFLAFFCLLISHHFSGIIEKGSFIPLYTHHRRPTVMLHTSPGPGTITRDLYGMNGGKRQQKMMNGN